MEVCRPSFFLAIILTTSILAGGIVRAETGRHPLLNIHQIAAFQVDRRLHRLASVLRVNSATRFRLIFPDKCRGDGEIELGNLAARARSEETFVFLPSHCLWVEVGYGESAHHVHVDTRLVEALRDDFREITVYHTHIGRPKTAAGYFPAYSDLVGLVLLEPRFSKQPGHTVGHRAVSQIGIIDYRFVPSIETEKIIRKLTATGLEDFMGQNIAYHLSRQAYKQGYFDKVRTCADRLGANLDDLSSCFPMSVPNFELRFHPFRQPLSAVTK